VIQLAKQGRVAIPAIPIDLLMNFYMFCIAHGETPFQQPEQIISDRTGSKALETMHSLYSLIDKRFFSCNPIAVAELMSSTNDYWYCPFAYCYSNYARKGFAKHVLKYAELVRFGKREHLRSTIGGTGIAVSSSSAHKKEAVEFASWICSGESQRTFYVQHGGQPGHRSAWLDEQANAISNNFFKTLLHTMDSGYMRPRYNGYLHFQDLAGQPLQDFLLGKTNAASALEKMNNIYRKSQLYNNPKPKTQNPKQLT
jgi:multiple sugar transport system substrate-binding protein